MGNYNFKYNTIVIVNSILPRVYNQWTAYKYTAEHQLRTTDIPKPIVA